MEPESHAIPHQPAGALETLRAEIIACGFERDSFLNCMLGSNVYGLNITIAWPLPSQYRTAYEEMAQHVAALDRGLYVYPFAQTHVTVITAVSFKHQINPCAGVIRLITDAAERLGDFVRLTTHSITPFVIDQLKVL